MGLIIKSSATMCTTQTDQDCQLNVIHSWAWGIMETWNYQFNRRARPLRVDFLSSEVLACRPIGKDARKTLNQSEITSRQHFWKHCSQAQCVRNSGVLTVLTNNSNMRFSWWRCWSFGAITSRKEVSWYIGNDFQTQRHADVPNRMGWHRDCSIVLRLIRNAITLFSFDLKWAL